MSERDRAYDVYMEALRAQVCSLCLDQKDDGRCGLRRRECALEGHLPKVVEAVLAVQSDRMQDYEDAIRALVCADCGEEDAAGQCNVRDKGECALDTYLYLVVAAIEQVRSSGAV